MKSFSNKPPVFKLPSRFLHRSGWLVLLLMICFPVLTEATHIIGGEMHYRCLGNDQYEISLDLYRDCFYGASDAEFDDPASIGVFDFQTNELLMDLRMPFMGDDTLNSFLADPCFVVPGNVCVHTTTYRDTVELLPRAGGYYIAYQRCCRNETINNIIRPVRTGATYFIILTEKALNECNSSPAFKDWPPIFVCLGSVIDYDHSATDAENDSLVYSLCTPFAGASFGNPKPQPPGPPPYDTVRWNGPTYSLSNLLGAGSPLRIDSQTGRLQGEPELIGQFVVGVCIEEYRNGILLSRTRRDFQYNVGLCAKITSAFQAPESQCDNLTVTFDNQSVASNSFEWIFDYPTGNLRSTAKNPVFTFPDTGRYTVALIAQPNSSCADTSFQDIYLQDNSLFANFESNIFDCIDSTQIVVTDLSFDTISSVVTWDWTLRLSNGDILTSNVQNPVFVVPNPDTVDLSVTITSANGCIQSLSTQIPVEDLNPGDAVPDTLRICEGSSIGLNPNGNPLFDYQWSPATGLDSTDVINPIATPAQTTTYTVNISSNHAFCNVQKDVTVIVEPQPQLDFTAKLDCDSRTVIFNNNSVVSTVDYVWSFGDPANPNAMAFVANPTYTYSDVGTYPVTLSLGPNSVCKDSITKNVVVEDQVLDADFEVEYQNCEIGNLTVSFTDNTTNSLQNTATYEWRFDPIGTTASGRNTQLILTNSQQITAKLLVTTDEGCQDSIVKDLDLRIVENLPDNAQQACATIATPLNPNPDTTYQYEWMPAAGLDDPFSPNPMATLNQSQTYTVRVRAIGADTCEILWDVDVLVPPGIGLQTSDDDITCDSVATLRASTLNNATITWFAGGVQIDTGRVITVPVSGITNYTARAEDLFGCTQESSVQVAGGPVNVDISGDQIFCLGDSFDLSLRNLDPNDDLTIQWGPPANILAGANTPNPVIANVPGRRTFTVDVSNQFGCDLQDTIELIAVDPDMVLDFDYLVQCDGLSVEFQNQSINGFDFVWEFNDPANPGATSNEEHPIYTYQDTGTYNVLLTIEHNLPGCSDSIIKPVNLLDVVLDASFETIYDNCDEDEVAVRFSNTSFSLQNNITSINWDFGIYGTSTANDTTIILNSDATISVRLIVEDAVGCQDSIVRDVDISLLDVDLQDSIIFCENDTVFLNSQFNPNYIYQWMPADKVDDPNAPNPRVTATETTVFTVIIQNVSADTCEITKQVTVVVPDPIHLDVPADTSTCGFPVLLTSTSAGSGVSYEWRDGNNTVIGTGASVRVNPSLLDTFTVVATDEFGCTDIGRFSVVNNQVDIATSGFIEACENLTTQIFVTNLDPNDTLTYNWTPPNRIIDGGDTPNPTVRTDQTGQNVFLVFVENQFGCRDTGSVTLNVVNFDPAFDDQLEICAGVPTPINPNGDPNQTYIWSPSDSLDDGNIPNPVATIFSSTIFTAVIAQQIDTLTCVDTVSVNVNVRPAVELMVSDDTTRCEPGAVELNASAGLPGLTYIWSDEPDFSNVLIRDSVLIFSRKGIYTFYVKAEDELGCVGSGQVNVNIVPIEVTPYDDHNLCIGENEVIGVTNQNPEQVLQYSWSPNNLIISGADTNSPTVNVSDTTTFTVNISNQFGCQTTEEVTINGINLNLLIDISATPDSILPGGSSELFTTFAPDYTYLWTPANTLDDNTLNNPLARPEVTTTYAVMVIDGNGCVANRAVKVTVYDPLCVDPYVFLPSAFSPNGDNHNDQLKVLGDFIEEMKLEIYNRWGQKVFEANSQNEAWDGTFKGEPVSPDVYGYYLTVKCINGEEYFKKGNVTLIR